MLPTNRLIKSSICDGHRATIEEKKIMPVQGQGTVWGTHIGAGRARHGTGWLQQLRTWWAIRRTVRQDARLTTVRAGWDATRETLKPQRVEAAADMAVEQGALSTATRLYGLTL